MIKKLNILCIDSDQTLSEQILGSLQPINKHKYKAQHVIIKRKKPIFGERVEEQIESSSEFEFKSKKLQHPLDIIKSNDVGGVYSINRFGVQEGDLGIIGRDFIATLPIRYIRSNDRELYMRLRQIGPSRPIRTNGEIKKYKLRENDPEDPNNILTMLHYFNDLIAYGNYDPDYILKLHQILLDSTQPYSPSANHGESVRLVEGILRRKTKIKRIN